MKNILKSISILVLLTLSACTSGPTNVNIKGPINVVTNIPIGTDAIESLSENVFGEVVSVNKESGSFAVKTDNGSQKTIKADNSELSKVQVGNKVRIIKDNMRTKIDIEESAEVDTFIATGNVDTEITIRRVSK
jgi:hypothetical protein